MVLDGLKVNLSFKAYLIQFFFYLLPLQFFIFFFIIFFLLCNVFVFVRSNKLAFYFCYFFESAKRHHSPHNYSIIKVNTVQNDALNGITLFVCFRTHTHTHTRTRTHTVTRTHTLRSQAEILQCLFNHMTHENELLLNW